MGCCSLNTLDTTGSIEVFECEWVVVVAESIFFLIAHEGRSQVWFAAIAHTCECRCPCHRLDMVAAQKECYAVQCYTNKQMNRAQDTCTCMHKHKRLCMHVQNRTGTHLTPRTRQDHAIK